MSRKGAMRNRSGAVDRDDQLEGMHLARLEHEIARAESRLRIAPNTYHRKHFFARLVWLESHREAAFGVPARKRVMCARQG